LLRSAALAVFDFDAGYRSAQPSRIKKIAVDNAKVCVLSAAVENRRYQFENMGFARVGR
jgi:hypothetical protein